MGDGHAVSDCQPSCCLLNCVQYFSYIKNKKSATNIAHEL